jgi:hypothetical protein
VEFTDAFLFWDFFVRFFQTDSSVIHIAIKMCFDRHSSGKFRSVHLSWADPALMQAG